MKDPLYVSIFKIQDEIKQLTDACVRGVDSWDKYSQLVGQARGLQQALDIINNVLKEDEEDKNDY